MPPEQNQQSIRRRGQITWQAMVVLLVLMVVPGMALYRLGAILGLGWVLVVWAGLCVITYRVYASDKRKAEDGEWRTPENTLHFLEVAGGWPAAFLAQRKLRHKISKGSYQFFFWTIILLHQAVATEFLLDWKFTRLAFGSTQGGEGREKPAEPRVPKAPAIYPPETIVKSATPPPKEKGMKPLPRPKKGERGVAPEKKRVGEKPSR
jgi:uncharacterized membrane protein YsdA (DUF1294 family)